MTLGLVLQYACFGRKVWVVGWYRLGGSVGPGRACFSLAVCCGGGCGGGLSFLCGSN